LFKKTKNNSKISLTISVGLNEPLDLSSPTNPQTTRILVGSTTASAGCQIARYGHNWATLRWEITIPNVCVPPTYVAAKSELLKDQETR
jgi:hypothetical protein